MKKIYMKTVLLALTGVAVIAMSGCDSTGSSSGRIDDPVIPPPPDTNGTEPLKDMTSAQAKDAMALNALFYPILTPLQSCLSDLPSCIGLNFPKTVEISNTGVTTIQSTTPPADMTPGSHECTPNVPTNGQYTVTETTDELVVTFGTDSANPGCIDEANSQDIEGEMMVACISKILLDGSASTSTSTVTGAGYKVHYEGKVTCTKRTSVVFDNYVASAFGNTDPNKPNRNSYNMTVSMTNGLGIDGTYHNEKWDNGDEPNGPRINDELWTFTNFNIALDNSNGVAVIGNGGASYEGKVRQGDTTNPSLALSVDFTNLTYTVNGSPDADVVVSGGVKASCQPEVVTYATTATLKDVDLVRDDAANRMPSEGSMSMTLPGYNSVPAVFSAPSSTSQVAITTVEGTVDYPSWRSITTTSSCSVLQEIIDRIIPPRKPIASIDIQKYCDLTDDPARIIDANNPLQLPRFTRQCVNAWATYRDGSRERVTTVVFWKSKNRDIATMDLFQRSSKVFGKNIGSAEITATLNGVEGVGSVEVISNTP